MSSLNPNKKVLIVGQNPGNNPKAFHYKNHTMDRLNNWCHSFGLIYYSFINCVQDTGNATYKNVDWNLLEASTKNYNKIIALGSFASSCLNKLNILHYRLPHPSPRNRMMNNKFDIQNRLNECKEYLNGW